MKKTLLLSVVASTMIMAGGDIAPVEPVVETPAVAVATSGWDFSGQAVVYYQTQDTLDRLNEGADLFAQTSSTADAGLQLRAVNKDLFAGIGAGVEVSALGTLQLENDVVSGVMQMPTNDELKGGWISQAYLTYAVENTSFKVGRQELPKALSPFAFSESWNVFKNTFDAALVVNSDIQDTTLVGAYVMAANSHGDMSAFDDITAVGGVVEADKGVFMLTAQNKSIANLTLTGTWYYAPDALAGTEDVNILWADAKYAMGDYTLAVQGGTIMGAEDLSAALKDTTAYGAKVSAKLGAYNACVAFSSVDDGTAAVENLGTNTKTPLYTQMIANQDVIKSDADYIKVAANTKALNGTIIAAYGYAINNEDDIVGGADNNPYELDLVYKTKVLNDSTTLLAAYVMADADVDGQDASNIIRVWGRYNF